MSCSGREGEGGAGVFWLHGLFCLGGGVGGGGAGVLSIQDLFCLGGETFGGDWVFVPLGLVVLLLGIGESGGNKSAMIVCVFFRCGRALAPLDRAMNARVQLSCLTYCLLMLFLDVLVGANYSS